MNVRIKGKVESCTFSCDITPELQLEHYFSPNVRTNINILNHFDRVKMQALLNFFSNTKFQLILTLVQEEGQIILWNKFYLFHLPLPI